MPINGEYLKVVYDDLVTSEGVSVLFFTTMAAVEMKRKGVVDAIVVANKAGLSTYVLLSLLQSKILDLYYQQLHEGLVEFEPKSFGASFLASTANLMGIRESRRIKCDYTFTRRLP